MLLDTVLERCMADRFEAQPARAHWESGARLPAGPGPYGAGFRALGSWREGQNSRFHDFNDDDVDLLASPERAALGLAGGDASIEGWQPIPREGLRGWQHWLEKEVFADDDTSVRDALIAELSQLEARFYFGAHAAWDRYSEDFLSRDEILGVVDDQRVLCVWGYRNRYYG